MILPPPPGRIRAVQDLDSLDQDQDLEPAQIPIRDPGIVLGLVQGLDQCTCPWHDGIGIHVHVPIKRGR